MQNSLYSQCIEACYQCAVACKECALGCLSEDDVHHMVACIQSDLECEAICRHTAEILSLKSRFSPEICTICAEICRSCAAECAKHDEEHCRICAQACEKCADLCSKLAAGTEGIL